MEEKAERSQKNIQELLEEHMNPQVTVTSDGVSLGHKDSSQVCSVLRWSVASSPRDVCSKYSPPRLGHAS
jgi:hypothetical protein